MSSGSLAASDGHGWREAARPDPPRPRAFLLLLLTLAGVLVAVGPARAQTSGSAPGPGGTGAGPGWGIHGSVGLGAGGVDGDEGMALAGRLAWARGHHHLLLRASGVVDLASESADPAGDLGILYGRAVAGRWGHLLAAAGVARTSGVRCRPPAGDCRDGPVVGFPVLGEVSFAPVGFVGLGLQVFGNLNGHASFGGLVLALRLGVVPGS